MRLHVSALVPSPFGGVTGAAARPPRPHRRRSGYPNFAPTAAERHSLAECLVLAALLHLLLVMLIGNVPGGSARPGTGVAGSLSVTLRGYGPLRDEPVRAVPAPATAPPVAPPARREPRPAPRVEPAPARTTVAEPPAPAIVAPVPQPTTAPPLVTEPAAPPTPAPLPTVAPELRAPELPPLPATAPPVVERAPAAVVERAPAAVVETAPAAVVEPPPTAPIAAPLPVPKPASEAPPATAPVVPPLPAPELALPAPPTPTIAAPPVPAPSPPATAAPAPPAPGVEPRAVDAAAPAAPSSVVPTREADVAAPPAAPAASTPPLNLQLPRSRGGELSGRATPGLLPLLPRPPERPSKLGSDIENAAKPDCRTAYASMGLLAAAPLAANAATGAGCRW